MSITDQITDSLSLLCVYSLCIASLPFSFPRNMPLFREVLSFYGDYQGTAKSWRFPCVTLSQGDCLSVLSFALPYSFVAVAFYNLHSHGSGPSLVSSILMAGKPPVGTDYRQEYPVRHQCFPVRDLPAISAGGE
jgi:hypothetical protein